MLVLSSQYDEWRLLWTPNGARCTNDTLYKMWCHDFSLWLWVHQSSHSHGYAAQGELSYSWKKKKSVSTQADIWVWKSRISARTVHWIWHAVTWYLQINRFLEAFHVTWLGKTHADTTCSYSTSWEALIFNTFGPYISLQLGSNLQLSWFWQLFKSVCIFRQLLSHTSLLLIY